MSNLPGSKCSLSRDKKEADAVAKGSCTSLAPLVQVLLSTYNGQRYLPQLLESLTLQGYSNVHILVRDDGSSDGTVTMLRRNYSHLNMSVLEDTNIGPTASFLELIRLSSPEADFYALCDQDDYWKRDKIARAVEKLSTQPQDVPAMYCSRLTITNDELEVLGHTPVLSRTPTFKNALLENIAAGCTTVLNKAARELLNSQAPEVRNLNMHDWWIYQVVSAFGTVVYDPQPTILYRQHQANSVGAKHGAMLRWLGRWQRFASAGLQQNVFKQAEELYKTYGALLPYENERALHTFLSSRKTLWGRVGYAATGEAYRQNHIDQLAFKILYLTGRA